MSFIQLVQPNLNISVQAGRCLEFTEDSFGVPNLYANAWEAWQATQYKHLDRNFPDVAVPVWFDWSGNILWTDGVVRYGRYGHAAVRTRDGKVHSAPGVGVGSKVFNNVDELTAYFGGGMTYVGWSEDIAGVNVIKEEDMAKIENRDQAKLFYMFGQHRTVDKVSNKEADGLIGQDVFDVINKWMDGKTSDGQEWNRANDILLRLYPNQSQGTADKKLQAIKDALDI